MARRRVTGADVAAEAGVSVSIVSLVLNGKDSGRANQATRDRVHAAAQRLGYRIDRRGRSLATGRTGIVGYVAPDVATPFFSSVQMGLLSELSPEYQVLTVVTALGQTVSQESVQRLLDLGVDGLIISTVESDLVTSLNPSCPVVILDSPGRQKDLPRVNLDVGGSARELARHLTGLGHRRFAYLDIDTRTRTLEARRKAFADEARKASEQVGVVVARSPIDVTAAYDSVAGNWPSWRDSGVTALVCGSDLQAFGALAALRDLGVGVPEEVSVAGADDQPMSRIVQPSLTTVKLPSFELGSLGARELRKAMDGPDAVAGRPLVLPTRLEIRESTGSAPAARSTPS
ncbi:LacI family DNA-binding transcriptional regulator [Streptomyces sp. NPDC002405]